MNVPASARLLAAGAFALPLFFLPWAFDAFLLPKGALLVALALTAAALRLREEAASGGGPWGAREAAWGAVAVAVVSSVAASPWRAAGVDAGALSLGWALTGIVAARALNTAERSGLAAHAAAASAVMLAVWALRGGYVAAVWTPMGHYNHLASLLVGAFPPALWAAWSARGGRRRLWAAGAFAVAAAAVCAGSRGVWLAALASWPLAAAALIRGAGPEVRRRAAIAAGGSVLIAIFLACVTPAGPFLLARARDALSPAPAAVAYRRLEWAAAIEMFRERPWLGQGPGGYHFRYLEHQARLLSGGAAAEHLGAWNNANSAHNAILQTAAEQGTAGLAALIFLAGVSAASWRRRRSDNDPLRDCWAAAALALAVDGLFNVTFQLPASLLLIALALAGASVGGEGGAEVLARTPRSSVRRVSAAFVVPILAIALLFIGRRVAAEVAVGRAWRLAMEGDAVGAERILARAVEWAPWYGRAHFFRGNALLLAGDAEGAEVSLHRSLGLQMDPNAVYDLALAALQRGDLPAARRACAEALRLKPRFPEALATLGDIAHREGRQDEAGAWFARSQAAAEAPLGGP